MDFRNSREAKLQKNLFNLNWPGLMASQMDMESLRYEISWKDERIEYLQKTLAEMEDSLPSSSADN
ncbi:unnamed protein product [Haemonchus placei]|uniref:Takusan domain-containing protein n=1 Tax=Haemonchus placei TaxID=6290 RepID=A0A0N4X3K4_HAEPC|nr:unnamed protein product [Haemonchus placei]